MSLETFLHFIKSNPKHFQLAYQPDGEDLDMKIPWVRAVRLTIPVGWNIFTVVIVFSDHNAGR